MSYVVLLLAVGVTIYALVDCWRSTDDEVRGLPRPLWILISLLFPLLGAVAYLLVGRGRSGRAQARVVAPDDDPEFLHQLDIDRRRADAQARSREQRERKDREQRERKDRERAERDRKDAERERKDTESDRTDT